jgi:hypothetical protein
LRFTLDGALPLYAIALVRNWRWYDTGMKEKVSIHTYTGEAPPERPRMIDGYQAEQENELRLSNEAIAAIEKVRRVLETVQQDALFEVFREYYERVGNDPMTLENTITPLGKVRVVYESESADVMGWHNEYTEPTLNAFVLQKSSDDQVVNTLIHEYLHEITRLRSDSALYEDEDTGEKELAVVEATGVTNSFNLFGFDSDKKVVTNHIQEDVVSKMANEGITQILADKIHAEYNRRTGIGNQSPERKNQIETSFSPESYVLQQFNIRLYIALISILGDVPESVVEQGVIRSYFRNGALVPDDIEELIPVHIMPADILAATMKRKLEDERFISFVSVQSLLAHCPDISDEKLQRIVERANELYRLYGVSVHSEYLDKI